MVILFSDTIQVFIPPEDYLAIGKRRGAGGTFAKCRLPGGFVYLVGRENMHEIGRAHV